MFKATDSQQCNSADECIQGDNCTPDTKATDSQQCNSADVCIHGDNCKPDECSKQLTVSGVTRLTSVFRVTTVRLMNVQSN